MNLAPIVLFCFNRPWHTGQTLDALAKNPEAKDSVLYIFSDGPKPNATETDLKKIEDTRQIIKQQQWCKEVHIIESNENQGLANSVIGGVTQIVNKYGKAIVLEDDLITAKGFLKYMNEALVKYQNNDIVMQISGHQFPLKYYKYKNEAFFMPFTTSWGWATWKRAWDKFDVKASGYKEIKANVNIKQKFDLNNSYPYSKMLINQMEAKKIDSWAIRWWWSVFKSNGIVLFPDKSLVKNIGFDNEGTHTKNKNPFEIIDFDLNYEIFNFPEQTEIDFLSYTKIQSVISSSIKPKKVNHSNSLINKILRKIKSILMFRK